MERKSCRTTTANDEVSLGSRPRPFLRLRLHTPQTIHVRVRDDVLSAVGRPGFQTGSSSHRWKSSFVRATGRAGHEQSRDSGAMGFPVWLGADTSPGGGGIAPLWIWG